MVLRPIAIRITNYKSIQNSGNCTLSADGITVLAGQNEAGKTSILEALDDFNTEIGKASGRKDFVPDHAPDTNPSVAILFKVDWQELTKKFESLQIKVPPLFLTAWQNSDEIWLMRNPVTGSLTIPSELGKHWPAPSKKANASSATDANPEPPEEKYSTWPEIAKALWRIWPEFVYFDAFDEVLPREAKVDIVTTVNGTATVASEPELPQPVEDFLTLSGIDIEKVRELAKSGNEKKLRNYLNSRSAEVTGDFHDYWRQTTSGEQKVKLRAEHFRRDGSLYLAFYADDGTTMQYPNQRSKGFLWFLSFYLRLSASVAKKEDRVPQFLLIDEPGSFLHQKAQRDILDVLEKRIAKVDLIMYSTHSPYMLPPDKMYRVRVVAKDKKGQTFIADRLTDPRIQRDDKGDALSPVMAAIGLDIGAGSHVMHLDNIVVEGISDYYYLQAFAKIVNSDIFSRCGIIAAKGTKNIPNLVSLCLAWSKSFAILVDHDDAGKAVTKELKEQMNISPSVIVSFKDALVIEDLLSPEDFGNLLAEFDNSLKLAAAESPSSLIKREKVDKVLLSRRFAELAQSGEITEKGLTKKTTEAIKRVLASLEAALKEDAVFRVTK